MAGENPLPAPFEAGWPRPPSSRMLAEKRADRKMKGAAIRAHLALGDNLTVLRKKVLDGVFNGNDMLVASAVNFVEQCRKSC